MLQKKDIQRSRESFWKLKKNKIAEIKNSIEGLEERIEIYQSFSEKYRD